MSLLMDALKKAEAAKRQAGEGGAPESALATPVPAPPPPELTLEPVGSPAPPPGSALPNLAQHQDSVDADLASVPTTAPGRKRPAQAAAKPIDPGIDSKTAAERNAARNLFSAKQVPQSRTPRWLPFGLVGLLLAAGIGGYFWWQLQSVSTGSLARPAAPPMSSAQVQPRPAQPPMAPMEARRAEPVMLPPLPEPARLRALAPVAQVAQREHSRDLTAPATNAESDRPIRLSTSHLKQDPTLNRAYDALLADNLSDARRDYEQVLRSDAKNTDALLGLATIAARQGQVDRATNLYLRVLEADPKDVNAKAGLINLKGQSDPALSESRLKTLLASQPESAALNFALGNLHARQGQWGEAQQAFFRAYTAEPDNADYLFNLAVSLDHLHQKTLSVQYYQMALNTAGTRGVAFDRNQVTARLLELQP